MFRFTMSTCLLLLLHRVALPADTPGPLDQLDPRAIPAAERFPWQPAELVAVVGEHRGNPFYGPPWPAALALSPDGKLLAAVEGHHVAVWAGDDLHLAALLPGHESMVMAVAFSPDGKTLATSGADKTIRLWDLTASPPRQRDVLRGHAGAVGGLAFMPDGKTLVSADAEPPFSFDRPSPVAALRIWDISGSAGREKSAVKLDRPGRAFALAPDGKTLAAAVGAHIVLWDLTRDPPAQRTKLDDPRGCRSLSFSSDGARLATASSTTIDGCAAVVWDLARMSPAELRLPGRDAAMRFAVLQTVAFVPGDKRLAAFGFGASGGKIGLWSLDGDLPRETAALETFGGVRALAFSGDGKRIVATAGALVDVWDRENGEYRKRTSSATTMQPPVAFGPDGGTLVCQSGRMTATVWDLRSPQPKPRFDVPLAAADYPFYPRMHTDGRTLTVTTMGGLKSQETMWDVTGEAPRRIEKAPVAAERGAFAVLAGGKVRVIEGTPPREFDLPQAPPWRVLELSPGGRLLAMSDPAGVPRFWKVAADGLKECPAPAEIRAAASVRFAPDDRSAVVFGWSKDKTHGLWLCDPDAGAAILLDTAASPMPQGWAAYAPDGKTVAVSVGPRIGLWDVATRTKIKDIALPHPVASAVFAPDGRHLAAASIFGTIYILRLGGLP